MKCLPLLITAAVLGAVSLNAQTTTYTVEPVNCGFYNPAAYNCPELHITGPSGTNRIGYQPLYNGQKNILEFFGVDGLDKAVVTSIVTAWNGTADVQTVLFTGVDSSNVMFNGISVIYYTTYHSGGGGGRGGGGAGTRWVVSGGKLIVARSPTTGGSATTGTVGRGITLPSKGATPDFALHTCTYGQLVSGPYPADDFFHEFISSWWYGSGCWEEGKVVWIEYQFPLPTQ